MARLDGQDSDAESDGSMPALEPLEVLVANGGPEAQIPLAGAVAIDKASDHMEGLPKLPNQEPLPTVHPDFPTKNGKEVGSPFQVSIVHNMTSDQEEWPLPEKQPDTTIIQPCSDEMCEEEYGYPKWPEEMKDPDYFRKELDRMRVDPRYNKNLGRGARDQEFWNEAQRMPWAKILLRKEQFWTNRRNVWLEQYNTVMQQNRGREEVFELLEDCPMDVKRLVTPIAKYKIVESLLLTVFQEARESGVPFKELIRRPETLSELHSARQRLDEGGDAEAQRMQEAMDNMVKMAQEQLAEERFQEEKQRGRTVVDMQGLKMALDFGQKCKKDGLVEWQRENFEEAIASWRQGDETLRKFRAPRKCVNENQMIMELHTAVLKNIAQAAIKLEYWGEAIEAADRALELNSDDHKAWFRKACALEGMGNFKDARLCLDKIEEIAVGRADRARLVQDCLRRRERYQVHEERSAGEQQRMLQRGLQKGVFSSDRQAVANRPEEGPGVQAGAAAATPGLAEASAAQPPGAISPSEADRPAGAGASAAPLEAASEVEHKRITRDGAWDLLADLEEAYTDPWFVKRVDKLAMDVAFDSRRFTEHLGAVALDAQRPVLEKWGFEPAAAGLQEMRAAVRDHTHGPRKDPRLLERAQAVYRALHGSPDMNMYERVMLGT